MIFSSVDEYTHRVNITVSESIQFWHFNNLDTLNSIYALKINRVDNRHNDSVLDLHTHDMLLARKH